MTDKQNNQFKNTTFNTQKHTAAHINVTKIVIKIVKVSSLREITVFKNI
jgi:hypothetical protein